MIIISQFDVYEFHGQDDDRVYSVAKSFVERIGSESVQFPIGSHMHEIPDKSLDMNNLEFDSRTLQNKLDSHRDEILKDNTVQDYLSKQRIHRINFLKEIQNRGLVTKDTSHDQLNY